MISTPNSFFGGGGGLAMLDENCRLVANEQAMIANAVSGLRHDEQVEYDREMLRIARQRMQLTQLFDRLGLTRNLGGLGTILSFYQKTGDFTPADVSMSGFTRASQDAVQFDEAGVPIPIIHKEFFVDARRSAMARRAGYSIETESIERATRVVSEEWERALIRGFPGIVVSNQQAYGLTTAPARNTLTLTASWVTTTGANITTDVNRMISAAWNDNFFGPYVLVVAKDVALNLNNDYSTAKGTNTIRERILAMNEIQEIVVSDYLAAGNVVLFQPTRDVIDIAIAQSIDNIPWQTQPFGTEYKVFMAGAPRIKSDISGNCGIVHGTP